MKFQLVLQFEAVGIQAFDEFVALEQDLVRKLDETSQVDGHDFGTGEFNIFVLTDRPKETFDTAKHVIQQRYVERLRAAYREVGRMSS